MWSNPCLQLPRKVTGLVATDVLMPAEVFNFAGQAMVDDEDYDELMVNKYRLSLEAIRKYADVHDALVPPEIPKDLPLPLRQNALALPYESGHEKARLLRPPEYPALALSRTIMLVLAGIVPGIAKGTTSIQSVTFVVGDSSNDLRAIFTRPPPREKKGWAI